MNGVLHDACDQAAAGLVAAAGLAVSGLMQPLPSAQACTGGACILWLLRG